MEVERLDVFDFKVTFSEVDFSQLSMVVDKTHLDMETVLAFAISRGILKFLAEVGSKET